MSYTNLLKQSLLLLLVHWSVGCLKGTADSDPRDGSSLNGAVSAATFASELKAQYRSCPAAERSRTSERLCQRRALSSTVNKLMPLPKLPTIKSPIFSSALLKPSVVVVNQRQRVVTEACPNLGELAADFAAECQAIASKTITSAYLKMLYIMANIEGIDVQGVPPEKYPKAARLLEVHLLAYAIEAYNNSPDLWDGQKDDIEITNSSTKRKCPKHIYGLGEQISKYRQNYRFPIYLMSEDFLKKRAFNIYKYAASLGKSDDCVLRSAGQALCLNPEPLYTKYHNDLNQGGMLFSDYSALLNDLIRSENPFHLDFPFDFSWSVDRMIPRSQFWNSASTLLLAMGGPGTYIGVYHGSVMNHAAVVIVTKDYHIYTQDFQSYIQYEGLPLPLNLASIKGLANPHGAIVSLTTGETLDPQADGEYVFMKVTNTPLPLDDKATLLVNYIDKLKKTSN